MKLKRVEIKNYKSCKHVVLDDFTEFNVLIGANNSGKTSIIQAMQVGLYHFINKIGIGTQELDYMPTHSTFCDDAVWLEIDLYFVKETDINAEKSRILHEITPKSLSATIRILKAAPTKGFISVSTEYDEKYAKDIAQNTQEFLAHFRSEMTDEIWTELKVDTADLNTIAGRISEHILERYKFHLCVLDSSFAKLFPESVRKYKYTDYTSVLQKSDSLGTALTKISGIPQSDIPANQKDNVVSFFTGIYDRVQQLFDSSKFIYINNRREEMKEPEISQYFALSKCDERPEIDHIEASINDTFSIKPRAQKQNRTSRERMLAGKYPISECGFGVNAYFRILHDIEMNKPSIVFLEEPELHLHPRSKDMLKKHLEENFQKTQMFITTHSSHYVNLNKLHQLYIVREAEYITSVAHITAEKLCEYCLSTGSNPDKTSNESIEPFYNNAATAEIRRAFFSKKIVLVEGPTEALALPIYIEKMNKAYDFSNIAIVSVDGKSNLAKWCRLYAFMRYPVYMIFDDDNSNNSKKNAQKELLKLLNISESSFDNIVSSETINAKANYCVFKKDFETTFTRISAKDKNMYNELDQEAMELYGASAKQARAVYVAERIELKGTYFAQEVNKLLEAIVNMPFNPSLQISFGNPEGDNPPDEPLTYDSLIAYLNEKYKHVKKTAEPSNTRRIYNQLDKAKYKTIRDIDYVIEIAKPAVEAFAEEWPEGHLKASDHLSKSLGFVDIEFRKVHSFNKRSFEAFIMYGHLLLLPD